MGKRYFNVSAGFKLQDFWVGAYWQVDTCGVNQKQVTLWVCLIPTLYIRFNWIK